MAYISQEEKRDIAPVVKEVLKKYGQKGTLSIRHHSSLVLKLKDVAGMFTYKGVGECPDRQWALEPHKVSTWNVNPYHYDNHYKDSPEVVKMLKELFDAMKGPNYFNHDDIMTDYFNRKHYVDIEVYTEV